MRLLDFLCAVRNCRVFNFDLFLLLQADFFLRLFNPFVERIYLSFFLVELLSLVLHDFLKTSQIRHLVLVY